jgi:hypothetical protein
MTVTVPTNASVAILVDAEVSFRQSSGAVINFAAAAGVTLNIPAGFDPATNYQGAVVTLKKIDTDVWDIFGALVQPTA